MILVISSLFCQYFIVNVIILDNISLFALRILSLISLGIVAASILIVGSSTGRMH